MSHANPTVVVIGDGIYAVGLAGFLQARGYRAPVVSAACRNPHQLLEQEPVALVIDLLTASAADFTLLRWLRSTPLLATLPVLVSSPGTVVDDTSALERRLRALGARTLLGPHDLETILDELLSLVPAVA